MENFFRYLNIFPMPLWLAMMFAPNSQVTARASRSSSIFMIAALHYVLTLLNALRRSEDGENLDFTSLAGISRGLGTREGALAAWAHMLALDLFTGAWIYRQCQKVGAPAWVRIPALGFTLMAGPCGLLLFLAWRLAATGQEKSI